MMCMLDEEIVLVGNIAAGEATREMLIRGVAWDEEITVMEGDGAIAHLRLVGDAPNRCIVGLGIDPDEVVADHWTEYGTALLSRAGLHGVDAIDILVPTSDRTAFIAFLEENGAVVPDAGRSELVRIELGMLDHRDLHLSLRRQRQMCIRDRSRALSSRVRSDLHRAPRHHSPLGRR